MLNESESIAMCVSDILFHLSHSRPNLDLTDQNLIDTPTRVAKSYQELLSGYNQDPSQILSKSFPSEDYDQMIVVKDIDYFSMCSHHMLPFYGKVAIGYIPSKESKLVVGLSKLPRLVECFSRRLQLQERMTMQIANAIFNSLRPAGVGVLVYDSIHLCSHMRGVKSHNSKMETSSLLGEFRNDGNVRSEFLRIVYGR